ncbi:hypothetical protein DESC_240093 [Desulfosarcina cetonica]|nr:hypothetical protein DESC_240093 [Desulfosarcina cetonica]
MDPVGGDQRQDDAIKTKQNSDNLQRSPQPLVFSLFLTGEETDYDKTSIAQYSPNWHRDSNQC